MIQFLDIECENSWCWGYGGQEILLGGGRLKELKIVVKERAWGGFLLSNTIDRELHLKWNEKELMDSIEVDRQTSWDEPSVSEDEEDEGRIDRERQLPVGVELATMWSWVAEEYDLVPISAGASAGYVAAGGVSENTSDT
jgi:hypothetical protein